MTTLPLLLTTIFLIGLGQSAFALNVANVQVEANNNPLTIPSGTPSIVSVPTASWIHGKIEVVGNVPQVESSLMDFVYMTKTDGYTTTIEFDGQTQNNTAVVNLEESGQTTFSLVLTPVGMVKTSQDSGWNIPSVQVIPMWAYGVILVVVVVCVVALVKSRRGGVKFL